MNTNQFPTFKEQLESTSMPPGQRKAMLAAIKLFSEQGYHATSTAQIAKEAGISQATIFKYFSTKEALLMGLLEPLKEIVGKPFIESLSQQEDLESLIRFIVRDRYAFVSSNVDFLKIILQEVLISPNLRNAMAMNFQKLMPDLFYHINKILDADEKMNQNLTQADRVRTIIAPLFTYVLQTQIFSIKTGDTEAELQMVEAQIIKSLRQ
ncbi:TetR/AcrR family transcriptional regulator [Staphylococcus muscae]|uniref:TetR family transcriptional regulator n=1 Tax=Staphylococcus muscae TaxID=1294 RepID=A0A240BWF7_9STAP|nr:TetR/AcrR family transcriptional regulator [Staphylococcus muscae]AVQ34282.1 TetR/AcrR family transcriptional regulator [Staphylococcus muscae]PNZ03867.1 TetR/AcrR family transcriptional regulator [Staphylococcus muscae]GGA84576.1 TetR family transcriptional regulator [Staphylococcus muscae]SNV99990.1 TetR family transcriptional regulator [Staphylococcus muscae]